MITIDPEKGTIGYEPNPDNIVKSIKILQRIRLNVALNRVFLSEDRRDRVVERINRRREYLKGI